MLSHVVSPNDIKALLLYQRNNAPLCQLLPLCLAAWGSLAMVLAGARYGASFFEKADITWCVPNPALVRGVSGATAVILGRWQQ